MSRAGRKGEVRQFATLFSLKSKSASRLTPGLLEKTADRVTLPPGNRGESDSVTALRLVDQFQRAVRRRNRAEIVERLAELIAVRVPMAEQWLQLSLMAIDLGEVALARAAADLYVEGLGGSPAAQFTRIGVLARIGAFEEVIALLRGLPSSVPDPFSYALARGGAALNLGETGEAREWLDEAIRHRPQSGTAWHSLSLLIDFAENPDAAERLGALEQAMQQAPAAERAFYYYALGKARADRGEHAGAFAAAARAAGETKALYPNDPISDRQVAMDGLNGYDPGRVAAVVRQQTEPTGRSIFVMGLPRSGTTLVEQVLTSHSAVTAGGEVNLLRLLVHETGGASYPAVSAHVQRFGAPPLAHLWQHLLDQRFPGAGRVVDKTTDTTRKLGIAATVLPDAPLIWLKRDPLDCAWSCFRTSFMQGIRWSNDLADIAVAFRLEGQLLAHWQRNLGERLLVVPYEQLASEPEPWIRRILAHCDLPEEQPAFAPHENRRAVTTASVMQVRRPIGRQAIGSAEPYRPFLKPFIEAYYD
jgi:tetratricopeptide (TPR) repeat protein